MEKKQNIIIRSQKPVSKNLMSVLSSTYVKSTLLYDIDPKIHVIPTYQVKEGMYKEILYVTKELLAERTNSSHQGVTHESTDQLAEPRSC